VDAVAGIWHRRGGQPGVAYGVVSGGRLVHSGGLGQRRLGGTPPDAGTVFRIASMTKSFTASAVLALRDDGALGLGDPAADWVPELRGWPPVTPDAGPVRLRHLLTMTAGFPTDDPWGDREQGTPPEKFSAFLSGGVRSAWAPGTRFEYSNLGYAILGRVVSAASGRPYADFVTGRLLGPLGLSRTGFEAAAFGPDELAAGYRRDGGGWAEIPPDPYGAFAPMGGIFSCVTDLAVWVSGLAAAFPPGAEDAGGPHPLHRATRRQMQLPQAGTGSRVPVPLPGGLAAGPTCYGFGLFIEEDPRWGRIVQHSGGYPGFGSNMRWHPATGIGVIVLGNGTYTPASVLASWLLGTLLRRRARAGRPVRTSGGDARLRKAGGREARGPELAPAGPWPETLAARERAARLLMSWDDTEAQKLFSENVPLDEPYADRRRKIGLIRERLGDLRDDEERPLEFDSPAHCRWWIRSAHPAGEGGTAGEPPLPGERLPVQVEIKLTPEHKPRVQALTLTVPPAPGSPLLRWLNLVAGILNDGPPGWPASLPVVPTLDTALLMRRLRMAAAWAGQCRPVAYRAGDGETSVTAELEGEHATLVLALVTDRTGDRLEQADILLDA
jgi:CubicO group peptidase (beta-lactamase class C family)